MEWNPLDAPRRSQALRQASFAAHLSLVSGMRVIGHRRHVHLPARKLEMLWSSCFADAVSPKRSWKYCRSGHVNSFARNRSSGGVPLPDGSTLR